MHKRRVAVFWIKLVAFLCVLGCVLNAVGTLLDGGDDVMHSAAAFARMPTNSADVLWLGTSHMFYNIIPQYLYDLSGVTSAFVTGNSQDLTASYWQLRQALLTQQPKVVVLDVYMAAAPYCYFYVPNVLATRDRSAMPSGGNPWNTATGMGRWLPIGSPYKPFAIAYGHDLSGADGAAFFSITRLHGRYSSLERTNFAHLSGQTRAIQNFGYLYSNKTLLENVPEARPYTLEDAKAVNEVGTLWSFTDEQLAEAELLPQTVAELERIISLCRAEGVSLGLRAAPYLTNPAEEKPFAQVGELAAAHGVPYVGLEASGIEGMEYLRDIGHLNDAGARLYTAFWNDYLAAHYALPDHRQSLDSRYAPWRDNAGSYDRQDAAMHLNQMQDPGLTEYLETVSALGGDYLVLLSAEGDVFEGFTDDDYLLMTESFGMTDAATEAWYYAGSGTLDAALCDGTLLWSAFDPEGCTESLRTNVLGHDVHFFREDGANRWIVDDASAGAMDAGMNIAVYSLLDNMLMDDRTFDMTEIVWDEEEWE